MLPQVVEIWINFKVSKSTRFTNLKSGLSVSQETSINQLLCPVYLSRTVSFL